MSYSINLIHKIFNETLWYYWFEIECNKKNIICICINAFNTNETPGLSDRIEFYKQHWRNNLHNNMQQTLILIFV